MNNDRREQLMDVADLLSEAIDRLDEVRDEEQDAFDCLPEGLQYSARGENMQDAIDTMDEWGSAIDGIRARIEDFATPKKKKK